MLRAEWGARASYASAWTDGFAARLREGRTAAAVAEPARAELAAAAEIRAFIDRHHGWLAVERRDLLHALCAAAVCTEFLERARPLLKAADDIGYLTVVGPSGRGTWKFERDNTPPVSWIELRSGLGYPTITDALLTALTEIPAGSVTLYAGRERTTAFAVHWPGVPT